MHTILIGTEAVANGIVTAHELRRRYRPLFPNVHAPVGVELTLRDRTDRVQYLRDRMVLPALRRLGWQVIGVVREDNPVQVLGELRRVMRARGWRGAVDIPRSAYSYAQRNAETAFRVA